MKRGTEHDLMRLLHGELPPDDARALRERLWGEPELMAAFRRLERTWRGLEPPPAAPVPPGFSGRVLANVRRQSSPDSLSWSSAPGWVRAAAATALVAGAALGIGVGRSLPAPEPRPSAVVEVASTSPAPLDSSMEDEDDSLAGSYWSLVEDTAASEEAMP